mmetsp:Transcript_942/g.3357  ORF Transcript_942/g.3357 Transcript_942/m.3357 type:complete len:222 (-) Transcript_942:244-909(-)
MRSARSSMTTLRSSRSSKSGFIDSSSKVLPPGRASSALAASRTASSWNSSLRLARRICAMPFSSQSAAGESFSAGDSSSSSRGSPAGMITSPYSWAAFSAAVPAAGRSGAAFFARFGSGALDGAAALVLGAALSAAFFASAAAFFARRCTRTSRVFLRAAVRASSALRSSASFVQRSAAFAFMSSALSSLNSDRDCSVLPVIHRASTRFSVPPMTYLTSYV